MNGKNIKPIPVPKKIPLKISGMIVNCEKARVPEIIKSPTGISKK